MAGRPDGSETNGMPGPARGAGSLTGSLKSMERPFLNEAGVPLFQEKKVKQSRKINNEGKGDCELDSMSDS